MPDIELHITDNLHQPTDPDIEIAIVRIGDDDSVDDIESIVVRPEKE
jgi:hypothetical protein